MRKLSLACLAFGAVITPTIAADMRAAPVYTKAPPAPIYNWTGFYVGGNLGYGLGKASSTDNFLSPCPVCVISPAIAFLSASESNSVNGVIGGGQVGYNWQVAKALFGIETDIQLSGQRGTNSLNSPFILPIAFFLPTPLTPSATSLTNTTKLEWFGTLRGRAGYVIDRWLVYGTGGLAYGEVNVNSAVSPATIAAAFPNIPFNVSGSATKVGWVLGAGVENALSANWSWKIEYLFMNLGDATATGGVPAQGCLGNSLACNGTSPGTAKYTTKFTDNIVRAGINYKFY
jgi:outer membrane immunogenic protein